MTSSLALYVTIVGANIFCFVMALRPLVRHRDVRALGIMAVNATVVGMIMWRTIT